MIASVTVARGRYRPRINSRFALVRNGRSCDTAHTSIVTIITMSELRRDIRPAVTVVSKGWADR